MDDLSNSFYDGSMVTKEMIKRIPKVELHDHLDGGLRPETIIELAEEYGKELPGGVNRDPGMLAEWLHRGAARQSLALYLEGFGVTLSVLQKGEALKRAAREAVEDLAAQNVVYAEIRFAPVLHQEEGLNLEAIVEAVVQGMEEGKEKTGMEYGLILCAMRHEHNALETAELAVAFRGRGVVGFDIAGDEHGHPPKKHIEAFQYIQRNNFNITIHAGEAFGPESIWQSLQYCGAHRIGHGTRLVEDMAYKGTHIQKMGSLAQYILDKRVPLEVCLSSNIQTGAAEDLDSHPFGLFFRNNFRVSLCTDNRLMSNTTQSREMELAVKHFNLGLRDLEKLVVNGMKSAFAPYHRRVELIFDTIKPAFARLRDETYPRA